MFKKIAALVAIVAMLLNVPAAPTYAQYQLAFGWCTVDSIPTQFDLGWDSERSRLYMSAELDEAVKNYGGHCQTEFDQSRSFVLNNDEGFAVLDNRRITNGNGLTFVGRYMALDFPVSRASGFDLYVGSPSTYYPPPPQYPDPYYPPSYPQYPQYPAYPTPYPTPYVPQYPQYPQYPNQYPNYPPRDDVRSSCTVNGRRHGLNESSGGVSVPDSVNQALKSYGGRCDVRFSRRSFTLDSSAGTITLDGRGISPGNGIYLTGSHLEIVYSPSPSNGFQIRY